MKVSIVKPASVFVTVVAFILPFATPIARADDSVVAGFGDPSRLLFKGDSPFTPAQMLQAVQADLELQLAASPDAPLDAYLESLARRLRAGFMRSGYYHPDVNVRADPNTGYVLITLDLGRRWKCGKVIVQGAEGHAVTAAAIVDCLTKVTPPAYFASTINENETTVSCDEGLPTSATATPEWAAGDPAPFDFFRPAELTRVVREKLASLGYFHPFLKVSVEPGETDATLILNLIDEGPRALLHKLKFQWLNRNTPEAMQDFLKIKPEDPVDLNRICQMQRQLWESGRFLQHSISVERISGDDSHVNLRVDIREAEHLPLINEPLSDLDQALLRCGKWLMTAGDDGEDLVINASDPQRPDYTIQFVWGGVRGMAARVKFPDEPPGTGLTSGLGDNRELGFAIKKKMAGLYLPMIGLKMDGSIGPPFLTSHLGITAEKDPTAAKQWNINIGANITTNNDLSPDAGALRLRRWIAPVAMLCQPRETGWTCQTVGPSLVIGYKGATIQMDAASGKLQSVTTAAANGGGVANTMQLQHGALDALSKSLQESAGENLASADHPMAAVLRLGALMVCHSNVLAPKATLEQRRKIAQAAGRLLDAKSLEPFDDLLKGVIAIDMDTDGFFLPLDRNVARPQGFYAMAAGWGLIWNDRLFERRSWPWTVCRSYCMAMVGKGDAVVPELQRMADSPDTGPLACLVNAELSRSGNPQFSQAFGNKGLAELSTEAFVKDAQQFFSGNPQMRAIAFQLTENFRRLSDDDIDAIATQLKPDASTAIRAAVKALQKSTGQINTEQVTAALSSFWNNGGSAMIKTELTRLATQ